MRFSFKIRALEELDTSEKGARKYPEEVVEAFFDVMAVISAAKDERDLRKLASLHYEKLKGRRSHQHSLKLHGGFRLVVERQKDEQGRWLLIIDIEDYH